MQRAKRRAATPPVAAASLAPLLAKLAPYFPQEIVSPAAVAQMERAAGSIFPASGIGFEARLAGDPSEVDLCIRVIPEDGSAAILGGWHPSHKVSAAVAADAYWQRLARLSRLLWAADDTLLRPFVNRLGLELDKADLDGVCARPSIAFFDLPDTAGAQSASLVKTMTDVVLPLALERTLADSQRKYLAAVAAAAVPFAKLRHIGASLTRPDPAVRLVFWLPLDRVGEYLAALGFGPRAASIGAGAAVIGGELKEVALQVDVTDKLGPRVGIEFHASHGEAWLALLKRLAAHRLCTVERAVTLSGWQRAPRELEGADRSAYKSRIPDDPAQLAEGLPVRLLNHVKLSFMPDGSLVAKIYLYAGFVWREVAPGHPAP
jgi:hypothetical protein